jgi:choline kinase
VSLAQGLRGVGTGDLLILDADVLFHPEVLGRLVGSSARNCALLDGRVTGSGEEMILCASDGRIWDIVRRRAGEELLPPQGVATYDTIGESVGFWKVGAQARVALQELTTSVLESGGRAREYESVFPALFARANFGFERVDDLAWIEIDFPDDVERARNEILPRIEACT